MSSSNVSVDIWEPVGYLVEWHSARKIDDAFRGGLVGGSRARVENPALGGLELKL